MHEYSVEAGRLPRVVVEVMLVFLQRDAVALLDLLVAAAAQAAGPAGRDRDLGQRIEAALGRTIQQKRVTYDLARQMDGATELRTSQFADAIISNM